MSDIDKITEEEFKEAVKEVLGTKRPPETIYVNRKPTKKELNTQWKLVRK